MRPAPSDARFFTRTRRTAGVTRSKLGNVVYHNKLGGRWRSRAANGGWAEFVAGNARCGRQPARNAAAVWPRPTCSPTWSASSPNCRHHGRYYAQHEGAKPMLPKRWIIITARALPAMNCPREQRLLLGRAGDKLDALVGFFGIGMVPTGDKDPFGLRRAALGVFRILMEKPLPLDLANSLAKPPGPSSRHVLPILRRFRDAAALISCSTVCAVTCATPDMARMSSNRCCHNVRPASTFVPAKLQAVQQFRARCRAGAGGSQQAYRQHSEEGRGARFLSRMSPAPGSAEKALFERVIPGAAGEIARRQRDYADALIALSGARRGRPLLRRGDGQYG